MRKVFTKIFGAYLIVLVLLSGMILIFSFNSIKNHYTSYLISDLKNYNEVLQPLIKPDLINNRYNTLDSLIKLLGSEVKARITVINNSGVVLADSKNSPSTMENHLNRPEIKQAMTEKIGVSTRFSSTINKDMLYVAIPIINENNRIAFLRLSLYVTDVNRLIDDLENKIINLTLLGVSISLIILLILSKRISNPIDQLVRASKKVALGEFKTKVYLKNKDEMKDLADSFNYMTEHISDLFNMLTEEKEKLDGLIKTLHEGLIVLDSEGKLLLANQSFLEFSNSKNIIGKYYNEVIENKDFCDFIELLRRDKSNNSIEIAINDKFFLCSANFLESRGNYVVIMHDVTQIKRLDQFKKDFIVNVSHELRTPLTAIKGFVETMEDDAREDQLHYLDIIHRHSDRLINIVSDLLVLSKLEQNTNNYVLSELDYRDYLPNLITLFDQKLSQKNIKLLINVNDKMPIAYVDAFKMEQLFINLIDNAIKYTDEGSISVSILPEKSKYRIEIADTGIGIPKEKLDRIFERFYVIDKSRSRKVGGTGLGLSIVKHIVLLHKGEIKVESDTGKGTRFIITLPYLPEISNNID